MRSQGRTRFTPRFNARLWTPLRCLALDLNIHAARRVASKRIPTELVCVVDLIKAKHQGGGAA